MEWNDRQTPLEDLHLESKPQEVQDMFWDFIINVPHIRNLISKNRRYAKDMPKDEFGRIIPDMENPHILENMDYFRPSAIHFEKYGCYTNLRPNPNPNSEFGKWFSEEVRRCWDGYIRPDGEWVTGDMYYYLNYCPIQLIKKSSTGKDIRTIGFPAVWDGQYDNSHYLLRARNNGHHASLLASRGKGKSFWGAGMLAKRFKLGESRDTILGKVLSIVTASDKKYIWGPNQILNMFKYYIDFQTVNTQFPSQMLTDSAQNLMWESGYKDQTTGVRMGTQNAVVGISAGVNQDKLNGSRGVLYLVEEAGIFNDLGNLYQMIRPSVEDGTATYGLIYLYGTAGDDMSDFTTLKEIMYHPEGYNQEGNINVYDKEGQGSERFTSFYGAHRNRANCYDKDGNSDVTKAILEICEDRYKVKYNSTDINAVTKRISQYPITPQEAIVRSTGSIFPVTELNERLVQIESDSHIFDATYVVDLIVSDKGTVEYQITSKTPIREFPLKDNKQEGAIEIHEMPVRDKDGNILPGRYICGADPYDDDVSNTMSLGSIFVMDTFTQLIVAEYTGRPKFVDDYYEKCRLLALFFNAKIMYENNKKGMYSYFQRMRSLHLLATTPDYLRQKELIKTTNDYGNKAVGICIPGQGSLRAFAFQLIREWLLTPQNEISKDNKGEDIEVTIPLVYKLKCKAALKELSLWNPDINVDRVMALAQLLLYLEEKRTVFGNDLTKSRIRSSSGLENDQFFKKVFKNKFKENK